MVKVDHAQLVAECMAVALSQAFDCLRKGEGVDLKKALDAARSAGRRDLTLGEVSLPNGVTFRNVQIDTPDDERQFRELVREATHPAPVAEASPVSVTSALKTIPKKEGLLSHQIAVHLGGLERANREKKTILDSRHTLRLLLGIVGDKPAVHTLSKHHQRLSVFLNFLLDNDRLQKNPFKGIAKASKFDAEDDTGRAFTQAELDAIFEPAAFAEWLAKYPHRLLAPLIGLLTVARITEVCQLYVDDIGTEHGVAGFHIRRGKPGQKLKNKSSQRFILIAQPLLDAAFLSFVRDMKAGGHVRLFSRLPNADENGFGRQMSRQFSTQACLSVSKPWGNSMPAYRFRSTSLDSSQAPSARFRRQRGRVDDSDQLRVG